MIIRRAGPMDARGIAALLNEIIAIGGTTALVDPVSADDIRTRIGNPDAVWHIAEDDRGQITGFQYIEPHTDLPRDDTSIATFVKVGETGLGTGSALFEATRRVAEQIGQSYLHAIIRADNAGGLAYYQSRGFEDYRRLPDSQLADGTRVDRVWKRYRI